MKAQPNEANQAGGRQLFCLLVIYHTRKQDKTGNYTLL